MIMMEIAVLLINLSILIDDPSHWYCAVAIGFMCGCWFTRAFTWLNHNRM